MLRSILTDVPPLSLYIHLPWCVRKCPYCDFNSHEAKEALPEALYVHALMQELDSHLPLIQDRPLISLFFGGGTPSLFSPAMIARIIEGVKARLACEKDIEITMEANPGTIEQARFKEFYHAGINRISLGIQSLQDEKLKTLGRIHDSENAIRAIEIAKAAGFANFNVDLMFGLPNQSIEDALYDLDTALSFQPPHLSWYQLTIEPNTFFHKFPPALPQDDYIWEMQLAGQARLAQAGLKQYEVSAYAISDKRCKHNLNYWEFGDYLGLGAGAHSKITDRANQCVKRFEQVKNPRAYLAVEQRKSPAVTMLRETDLIFEFMLNALRLREGVALSLFTERTGLPKECLAPMLMEAVQKGLLERTENFVCPTEAGRRFLNNLMGVFL